MLMGAIIGGVVGLVFYLVKNAQEKKKAAQSDSVIDTDLENDK